MVNFRMTVAIGIYKMIDKEVKKVHSVRIYPSYLKMVLKNYKSLQAFIDKVLTEQRGKNEKGRKDRRGKKNA